MEGVGEPGRTACIAAALQMAILTRDRAKTQPTFQRKNTA